MIARMFNQDAEAYTNMKTIQAVLRTYIRASTRVSQAYLERRINLCVSRFWTLWCQKRGGMAVAQNRITREETTGFTTTSLIILIHESTSWAACAGQINIDLSW